MKKYFVLTFLLILKFVIISPISANSDFSTEAKFDYKFQEDGSTSVTNSISIKNLKPEVYSDNFIFQLNSLSPESIKIYEGGYPVPFEIENITNSTTLNIKFKDKNLGVGNIRNFIITYTDKSFSTKTGDIWEINIPKFESVKIFDSYKVNISIPKTFGIKAYLAPMPTTENSTDDRYNYLFDNNLVDNSAITSGFGQFQVFKFSLNFNLDNELNEFTEKHIAIPPDTSTQKVYYQKIDPSPENIILDDDGNWLAYYKLNPREKINILVEGYVNIFSKPQQLLTPIPSNLLSNTKYQQFWESEDRDIKELANSLKTPENIYDYVSKNLSYDYQRISPDTKRMGAKLVLENPDDATCMEFTDLFIALARAVGIPAREINGFAYSENLEIQPLSLIADVLHSWPEYWDSELKMWVPVDPTWGSTTGGVDYFNKLDLRHFAFVIHGNDPQTPHVPGSSIYNSTPEKDITVEIIDQPENITPSTLSIKYEKQAKLNLFTETFIFNIENDGQSAIYNVNPTISFDENTHSSDFIQALPPFSKHQLSVKVNYGLFGKNAPKTISVKEGDNYLSIPISKSKIIIYHLVVIFGLLITIIASLKLFILKKS